MDPAENGNRSKTAVNARRASTMRTLLILLMGSKCHYCPERRPWKMEFHHTKPPKWRPARTSRHRRIKLYARDWGDGICVLACGSCNKKKGSPAPDDMCEAAEVPIPD
jgi:hypothetical protein